MAFDAMTETGVNPKRIYNPIGGCDSTPFHKKGIATCTLAAQNPTATDYYHTFRDKSDRFKDDVLADGFEVILRFTDKIIANRNSK
jgi:Iap family predicted aminopeptidase